MNWQIGDVAIMINDGTIHAPDIFSIVGSEVELLRPCAAYGYDWDISTSVGLLEARESCLRKLPPPNEVTTWDTCEFQPKELVGVDCEIP